jgi:hypothetical protein
MWNQLESLNVVWNVFCIIVVLFSLILHCCYFISVVSFLLFCSYYFISLIGFFSFQNKMLDQLCHRYTILEVLLINSNRVTQLS